ncbi:MAG: hypothetical protein LAT63_10920 [Marinobacter sp.]|nr:hypothetical protein [Marinobacter sp.]
MPHLLVPMEEVAVNANPQPDSLLHEAELERLSGVFLNTVYPSFQSGFRLDLEGRAAIDVFVASMPEGLSSEELATISAMIERQLFTPEADDVAFIITHLYRLEQEQARMLSEGAPITTMAGQLEAQQRLSQLRDDWFGPELAERLFSGTDDVDAATGESPARNPAGGTNTEELPERLTGAQAELAGMESAWAQRYQRFLAEKQFIDNAGLDETEKDQQIEALLRQHYPPEELEAARAFGQQKR